MDTCNYCAKELPEGALVCTECNHYQVVWKNSIKFLAALLTFVLSSAEFIASIYSSVFVPRAIASSAQVIKPWRNLFRK